MISQSTHTRTPIRIVYDCCELLLFQCNKCVLIYVIRLLRVCVYSLGIAYRHYSTEIFNYKYFYPLDGYKPAAYKRVRTSARYHGIWKEPDY